MTVNKLIIPGAKAYLDIPKQQMIQFGLRPSKKLNPTVFGPFPIVRLVSQAETRPCIYSTQ